MLWSRPRSLSKCVFACVWDATVLCLQTTGWITRMNLCYPASKLTPSHLTILHVFLFQLILHFLVVIHVIPKCLLNLSLHVLKLPYLFIPTYRFSLYVSVNLQSLPFIYCVPHSHPSVHESVVLFPIRWLAHCRIPLYQIETWSLMKGHPIERARCWLMTCTLMLLLVREPVVRETPAGSCGYTDKGRRSSGVDGLYCGLSLGFVFEDLCTLTRLHVPWFSVCWADTLQYFFKSLSSERRLSTLGLCQSQ